MHLRSSMAYSAPTNGVKLKVRDVENKIVRASTRTEKEKNGMYDPYLSDETRSVLAVH